VASGVGAAMVMTTRAPMTEVVVNAGRTRERGGITVAYHGTRGWSAGLRPVPPSGRLPRERDPANR